MVHLVSEERPDLRDVIKRLDGVDHAKLNNCYDPTGKLYEDTPTLSISQGDALPEESMDATRLTPTEDDTLASAVLSQELAVLTTQGSQPEPSSPSPTQRPSSRRVLVAIACLFLLLGILIGIYCIR